MWFLLAACTDDDGPRRRPPDDTAAPVDSTAPTPPTAEVAALLDAGFEVREGAFATTDPAACCEDDLACWGNGPDAPYATVLAPLGPDQAAETPTDVFAGWGPVPLGLSRTFHLRADEALVVYGTMPLDAGFFSYRSYLAERVGLDAPILGSLGPSSSAGWEQPVAFVTTLDAGTERRVLDALVTAGWEPGAIRTDRIPGDLVQPGVRWVDDTFAAVVRTGSAAPSLQVLRVTPHGDETWAEPWPLPELPARGTGSAEDPALVLARDELLAAVQATFADRTSLPVVATPDRTAPVTCAADALTCGLDLHERFAAVTPDFQLRAGELVVALGPNHARTGKGTWARVLVRASAEQRVIATLDHSAMPGSAEAFLPGHPLADELYAWVIARSCAGLPEPCVEIPDGCPGTDEGLQVVTEVWLEPETGAAPIPEEMVGDAVVKIGPP